MAAEPLPHHMLKMATPRLRHRPAPVLTLFPDEPLGIAIQRTTLEQFDHTVWVLRHELDRDVAVHEARKALKRIRAIVRLVRSEIGDFAYRQENYVLREAGRRLSVARSATVVVDTTRQFLVDNPGLLDPIAARRLMVGLETRRDVLRTPIIHDRQLLTDLVTSLLAARARYASWPIAELAVDSARPERQPIGDVFESIALGLERTYRRGLEAMNDAVAARSATSLHQWRKRVKYLRYQHEFLEELWPPVVGAAAQSLGDLSDGLGIDHDHAELAALVATKPSLILDPTARYRFLSAIDRHRRAHQTSLLAIGGRSYAETPSGFLRRLGSYWDYARS